MRWEGRWGWEKGWRRGGFVLNKTRWLLRKCGLQWIWMVNSWVKGVPPRVLIVSAWMRFDTLWIWGVSALMKFDLQWIWGLLPWILGVWQWIRVVWQWISVFVFRGLYIGYQLVGIFKSMGKEYFWISATFFVGDRIRRFRKNYCNFYFGDSFKRFAFWKMEVFRLTVFVSAKAS